MAEQSEKPKEIEHAAGAKTSRRKLVLLAGVVTAVLGVGAPVGYLLFKPADAPKEEPAVGVDAAMESVKEPQVEVAPVEDDALTLLEGEEALGAIVPFDTFLVNLSGGKYLRLQVQAEMETPDIPRRLYGRIVPIRDGIITMLTQKSAADLESVEGKSSLKKGIKDLINEQLHKQDVRRIYFTQFVIQ